MARTILEDRVALILGVENAVGRSVALQLSRAGVRVILASHDEARIDHIAQPLKKKGGKAVGLVLPKDDSLIERTIIAARDTAGHIHMVFNALALGFQDYDDSPKFAQQAIAYNAAVTPLLAGRGPLKMLTAWIDSSDLPPNPDPTAWHGVMLMPDCQRLDTQMADQLDKEVGRMHIRAGAAGDAAVFLFQLPPSACPRLIHLQAVPSSEKTA